MVESPYSAVCGDILDPRVIFQSDVDAVGRYLGPGPGEGKGLAEGRSDVHIYNSCGL